MRPIMAAGFIHDMALMEDILIESNLSYTVVRPPGLTNGKHSYCSQESARILWFGSVPY